MTDTDDYDVSIQVDATIKVRDGKIVQTTYEPVDIDFLVAIFSPDGNKRWEPEGDASDVYGDVWDETLSRFYAPFAALLGEPFGQFIYSTFTTPGDAAT